MIIKELFQKLNASKSLIERSYSLPVGTIDDAINREEQGGRVDKSLVAILKLTALYPFLTDIADHKYDRKLSLIYLKLLQYSAELEQRKEELKGTSSGNK